MEPRAIGRLWLPALAVFSLWLLIIRQVGNSWTIVPQYNYGWFMPVLACVVWWGRWKTRPEPGPAPVPRLLGASALCLIFLLLPIRLVQEANRDWLLVSWGLAGVATGLVALTVAWSGGLPWLKHFAFPLLFPLVAVPWPSKIEQPVVHGLMALVAQIGAETMSASGIPAIARGSVVEIGRGMVGIDEACSGIQSFQASVMVSLFIGELFAFAVAARLGLFVAAMFWAFLCNIGRTLFLTYICDRDGYAAIDRYHDQAGLVVMIVCYSGIIVLALYLSRNVPQPKPTSPTGVARPLWGGYYVAGLAWIALSELGTAAWYNRNPITVAKRPPWTIEMRRGQTGYHEAQFSGGERTILRYNEAKAATWSSPAGYQWRMSFIRWDGGNLAVNTAREHNPTVCLAGSGWVMKEEFPARTYRLAGHDIPFRSFRFAQGDQELITFFCIWDDFDRPAPSLTRSWTPEQSSAAARLRNVLAARRTTGVQLLNAAVAGCKDWEPAAKEFEEILAQTGVSR